MVCDFKRAADGMNGLLQAKEEADQLDQLQTDRASLAFGSALVGYALALVGCHHSLTETNAASRLLACKRFDLRCMQRCPTYRVLEIREQWWCAG